MPAGRRSTYPQSGIRQCVSTLGDALIQCMLLDSQLGAPLIVIACSRVVVFSSSARLQP